MAEYLIINLESRILGLKKTELVQFGVEMKWITVEEIGEKGRLDLIKIIRSAFEEEIQKCDTEQLVTVISVTSRANTGPVVNARPVLFEPDERSGWPAGLIVHETLTTVKKEESYRFGNPGNK